LLALAGVACSSGSSKPNGTGGAGDTGGSAAGGSAFTGGSWATGGSDWATGGSDWATGGGLGGVDQNAGGAGGAGGKGPAVSGPYPSQACLDRANGLVAQMTADEKYAQMLQLERAALTPQMVTQYGIGSAFSQGGSAPATNSPAGWADMADAYRQAALASRLKVPFLYGADEVHGAGTVKGATIFPHNIGLGATRDLGLVEQIGRIAARESLGSGVDFVFSPVVAVALNERWGRTYEAFGETTELAARMGVAMTRGLQFTPTGASTGLLANVKHYLGDGGTADGVNAGKTSGDEAALRALHLEPYRAAVAAHAGSVMASYSQWQGVWMHANKPMITDVLKGELGFGGFVISDFNACFQICASSNQDGIGQCLNAGIDMFMIYNQSIGTMLDIFRNLVKAGTVKQERVDDAVRRILAVKCELGLFEATGKVDRALTAEVGSAEHRQLARKAVQESLVVLKNDGAVLPLAKTVTVALGGRTADNTGNQCGGWTITWQGSTDPVPGATSIRQGFEAVLGAAQVKYKDNGSNTTGASVGITVVGETPYAEGKGDRSDLALNSDDVNVLKGMKQAGLKTVLVLVVGRPMIIDAALPYADAVVVAWLPGSEGAGVTDVLFGDAKPTGKLPHSWPRSMAQIPINVGDATYDPLFPYGFGLTY